MIENENVGADAQDTGASTEYRVKSKLKHNDVEYNDGDSITLNDSEAAPLKEAGVIEALDARDEHEGETDAERLEREAEEAQSGDDTVTPSPTTEHSDDAEGDGNNGDDDNAGDPAEYTLTEDDIAEHEALATAGFKAGDVVRGTVVDDVTAESLRAAADARANGDNL